MVAEPGFLKGISMPMMFSEHSPAAWVAFCIIILGILAIDLAGFDREPRVIPVREALWRTAGYVALALSFNAWIYWQYGHDRAVQFLTGYFIEYALSMDNVLVFVVILAYFQVPPQSQMRVLMWGIFGALILRAVFILAGLALLELFDWMVIVLGAFLILTGIRTMRAGDAPADLQKSRVIRLVRRIVPVTAVYDGGKFITRKPAGKAVATPLLLVLVVLNITDIVFAFDSIPAVFAITRDPFIVYTSNVFAVLGLRALYFAVSGLIGKFRYLKFGLSLVLIFIGIKMIYNYPDWLGDIPTEWALGITALLISGSILASLIRSRQDEKAGGASTPR
jgi:tellurite resistance protein TerC